MAHRPKKNHISVNALNYVLFSNINVIVCLPLPEFQVEDITFDSYQVELLFKGEKQLLMVNHRPGTRDKMNRKTHILVLAVMETLQVGDLTKKAQKSNKRIK